jgi:hypothetical protein
MVRAESIVAGMLWQYGKEYGNRNYDATAHLSKVIPCLL